MLLAKNHNQRAEPAPTVKPRVPVNARGFRIGEGHPSSVLTDNEVDVLLELRDEGWGYKRLARHFDVARTTVRNICSGKYRSQTAERYVPARVRVDDPDSGTMPLCSTNPGSTPSSRR